MTGGEKVVAEPLKNGRWRIFDRGKCTFNVGNLKSTLKILSIKNIGLV